MTELSAPRFPGLAGYRALAAGLTGLGLRHVADLFAAKDLPQGAEADAEGLARFLVVDGFRLARPGNRWRRVDATTFGQARTRLAERFGAAAGQADELLNLLESALEEDSDLVRHLLLYQLAALATAPRPVDTNPQQLLLDLGVHSDEVDVVCAMVGSRPRPSRAASAAAEQLADAFTDGRMFAAGELLRQVQPGTGSGDWRLGHLENEVNRRLGRARRLIEQAGRLADADRFEQATELYLEALAAAADEPGLRDGLVRAAIGISDANAESAAGPVRASSSGALRAIQVDDGVELTFGRPNRSGAATRFDWTLLRVDCATQSTQTVADECEGGMPFIDTTVRFGQEVRYVAIPYRNVLICNAASASGRIRYAPDVDEAALRYTPQGVRLEWRRPGRAVSTSVLRSSTIGGPEHVEIAVRADATGANDFDVTPGTYRYVIRCGYPAPPDWPDSGTVWSAGLTLTAVVKPWPAPVDVLRSELIAAQPLTLRINWLPPAVGTARVVLWQFSPREPGSDISELARELPPGLTAEPSEGPHRSATVVGRPAETLRLTAVSELGDRALAGASILIQIVRAPGRLRVWRVEDTTAIVRFDWPEPAVLVSIRWEQDGLEHRRTVPRSRFSPEGMDIPVNASACHVTVEPLGRPDAQVISSPVSAVLPALPAPPRPVWRRAARWARIKVLRPAGRLVRRLLVRAPDGR